MLPIVFKVLPTQPSGEGQTQSSSNCRNPPHHKCQRPVSHPAQPTMWCACFVYSCGAEAVDLSMHTSLNSLHAGRAGGFRNRAVAWTKWPRAHPSSSRPPACTYARTCDPHTLTSVSHQSLSWPAAREDRHAAPRFTAAPAPAGEPSLSPPQTISSTLHAKTFSENDLDRGWSTTQSNTSNDGVK